MQRRSAASVARTTEMYRLMVKFSNKKWYEKNNDNVRIGFKMRHRLKHYVNLNTPI